METLQLKAPAVDGECATICFALFTMAALIGLLQLAIPTVFGPGSEMVALAINLANNGSFANPFWVLHTGPTAANPPLYPLFLALLIKVLRLPPLILDVVSVGNITMNALVASLLPRVSKLFYGDLVPGIVAAIFWLGSTQLMPAWDVSYTVALLLVFCLCTASQRPEARKGFSVGLLGGIIAGLLFLLNPSSLLITLPWAFYLVIRRAMPLKEAALLMVILVVTIFGWMARNHRQLGAFVVRTNLGPTLYASNNDCAKSSMFVNELNNCYQTHSPNTSLSEAQLLQKLGEVKYDHQRTANAEGWIKEHPKRFFSLTAQRFREFWFPPFQTPPYTPRYTSYTIWVATALSIPGLILMGRRGVPVTIFPLMVLIVYPPIYYVVVSDVRYRYPVLWLSLLPAGYFVQHLVPIRFRLFVAGLKRLPYGFRGQPGAIV